MPTCCICNRELPRAAFSKSQLKRKNIRKCLECLAGHHSSHRDDPDEPFAEEQTSLSQESIDLLVNAFLEPNRLAKIPADLRSRDALSLYFRQLFCQINSTNSWLVEPLIKGLARGQTHINKRVQYPAPRMEPLPLLFWVVQWKHVGAKFHLAGADEKLVALVLAAGANVNAITHRSKINAAFFAVNYASLDTLKLLAGAGMDMHHRDSKGCTCFYHALERCDPSIIRYLLDKADFNVMEQFPDAFQAIKSSAPDHILSHFSNPTFDENGAIGAPASWQLIGPPPIQDIAETLILLRQRGATFTGANRYAWDCMGLAAKRQGDGAVHEPRLLAQLYSSLLGMWLPPSIQNQIDEQCCRGQEQESQSPEIIKDEEDCKLCLNTLQKEEKGGKRAVRLYCGHAFCQDCILEHSKKESHCPVCGLILCRDVMGEWNFRNDKTCQQARLLGLRQLGSFESLTKDQILHEARTRKMSKSHRNLSVEQIKEKMINDDKNDLERFTSTPDEGPLKNARFLVELSATDTVAGGDRPTTVFAPKNGPAMIEITIKGIPVVARLSNNTTYTCVSASVVKTFNLKKVKSLRSSQFRDALSGDKIRHFTFTCLEDFCFTIGGIQVKLANAVECKPDLEGAGIQLGVDFFRSARWCMVGVQGYPGGFFRVNYSDSWVVKGALEEESTLRYYSHNDEIAHLPLLFFNPHKNFRAPVIALDKHTDFVECNWCCRIFPLGMLQCTTCQEHFGFGSHYCDRRCQRAGWELHKITSEGHISREEMIE